MSCKIPPRRGGLAAVGAHICRAIEACWQRLVSTLFGRFMPLLPSSTASLRFSLSPPRLSPALLPSRLSLDDGCSGLLLCSGLASGLGGADDAYNVYDKALFRGGSASEAIYRPSRAQEDGWGDEDAAVDQVMKAARFKPGDKGFDGAGGSGMESGGGRNRPVEFEQEAEADPFGLDEFLSEAKRGKALDGIGESGGMGASAGGSMDGGSGRSSLAFQKGGA